MFTKKVEKKYIVYTVRDRNTHLMHLAITFSAFFLSFFMAILYDTTGNAYATDASMVAYVLFFVFLISLAADYIPIAYLRWQARTNGKKEIEKGHILSGEYEVRIEK